MKAIAPSGSSGWLAYAEFAAYNNATNEKLKDFRFASPVKLAWRTALATPSPAKAAISTGAGEVTTYWHNGVEWVKIGHSIESGIPVVLTTRLGKYALKAESGAQEFTLNKIYPRIFTPNGDNRNDHVEFQYENPRAAQVTGKVFDIRGIHIAELKDGPVSGTLLWDGKKNDGSMASHGMYIYQIEVSGSESKSLNGMIIIAQ